MLGLSGLGQFVAGNATGVQLPVEEMRTIYVSNVAPTATEADISLFFATCGNVLAIRTIAAATVEPKFAFVQFASHSEVRGALALDGVPLLDHKVVIVVASSNDMPNLATSFSAGLLPTPQLANPATQSTSYVPSAPPISNAQKADEVARTVYVGNVNSGISAEQLMAFFSMCGPITYCRMAGDESHPSRFAFVEFATHSGAQAAMGLNGSLLLDRQIKVNHSKNPIVKPPKITATVGGGNVPGGDEELMRRLKRVAGDISARILGAESKEEGSPFRSRDRHRSSRSRRSRSRSSSRDKHRSSGRSRRSRSRSSSRDRSSSHRSSSRRSSRSSRSPSRRDRDRDRDRSSHRSERDRNRDKDRHRDKDRDTHRESRKRSAGDSHNSDQQPQQQQGDDSNVTNNSNSNNDSSSNNHNNNNDNDNGNNNDNDNNSDNSNNQSRDASDIDDDNENAGASPPPAKQQRV